MSTIQTGYDRWSTVYDHDANPLPALEEPLIRQAAGTVEGLRVLDAGCGTGRHSTWLAEAGATVTAMDFSAGMLEQAMQKSGADRIHFLVHDLHQPWPLHAGSFDLVVSGLVLEHIFVLKPFFDEVKRVLKPGGRALMSTLHPTMFLRGSQARFTDPTTGELVQPGSIAHTMGQFVMAALHTGFTIDKIHEVAPNADFVQRYPRAEKYLGWPMLLVMVLSTGERGASAP